MPSQSKGGWIPARVSLAILCATGVMELYMTRINLSIAIVAMVQTVSTSNLEAIEDLVPRKPYCERDVSLVLLNGNSSFNAYGIPISNDSAYGISISNDSAYGIPISNDSTYEILAETATNSTITTDKSSAPEKIIMTSTERGNVLSAFFYAYGFSGILGGRLAEIYGTKRVFGAAVFVDALGNFLIPIAAKTNYWLFFFIRFIMGFFQGACYPSLHALVSVWTPPDEVSRFMGFVYVANSFGVIFTLTACGVIISVLGWEITFYICGAISLTWLLFWVFLMYDSPDTHPRISEDERLYIKQSKAAVNRNANKPKKVPWLKMLKSVPMWAIHIAHAGNMFGVSFFITQLPIYMSSIIGLNIRNNGLLSSLPFLARFAGSNAFSWGSNFCMKRTNFRKKTWLIILTVFGFGGPAVCLVLVGYSGCNATMVLALFCIGLALNGSTIPGYCTNHIDNAPNFAGTALGMSSMVGFGYAMIGPVLIGAWTPEETLDEWVTVYWFCFVSFVATGLFFSIFVSTKIQPWNNDSSCVTEERNTTLLEDKVKDKVKKTDEESTNL